jgi:hypothetical protein
MRQATWLLFDSAKRRLAELGVSNRNAKPFDTTTEPVGTFNEASWRKWIENVSVDDADQLNALCRFSATCGRRLGEIATHGNDPLQDIVDSPQEKYDVELKPWLSITEKPHIAKFAKALIALRNNNGGHLVLGIEDDGSKSENPPADLQKTYHIDLIQQIVSKYASDPFPIEIEMRASAGQNHPIIVVPSGVESPVFARSTITHPETGKKLIEDDAIYVRSITANHRVSSSKLRRSDGNRLMRICFENREADIGGFIRRHLTGLNMDVLQAMVRGTGSSVDQKQAVLDYLDNSFERFTKLQTGAGDAALDVGYMEYGGIINGIENPKPANSELLYELRSVQRDASGWPPWTFIHNRNAGNYNPRVVGGSWEAFMDGQNDGNMAMLDFWKIDPAGKLYYSRALEDDLRAQVLGVTPKSALDFHLVVLRVTEIVLNTTRFARALSSETEVQISSAFRWRGLHNRVLTSWSQSGSRLRRVAKSYEDSVTSEVEYSSNLADSAVPNLVYDIVRPLFLSFEGYDLPQESIEGIASTLANSP